MEENSEFIVFTTENTVVKLEHDEDDENNSENVHDIKIDYTFKSRTDGTQENPLLVNVTSGQRESESLIHHMKIENNYYQMRIKRICKGTCNLVCAKKHCKATAKLELDRKFIIIIPNHYKMNNGRFRSRYTIDYSDTNLRRLENWKVLPHISKFQHNYCSSNDFFTQYQKAFRAKMTNISIKSQKPEYKLTLNLINSESTDYESLIGLKKTKENRAVARKLKRIRDNMKASTSESLKENEESIEYLPIEDLR